MRSIFSGLIGCQTEFWIKLCDSAFVYWIYEKNFFFKNPNSIYILGWIQVNSKFLVRTFDCFEINTIWNESSMWNACTQEMGWRNQSRIKASVCGCVYTHKQTVICRSNENNFYHC